MLLNLGRLHPQLLYILMYLEVYWSHFCIQNVRYEFPTIFSMAPDYLHTQATSIPCERIFSSGAETDTTRRNRLSPEMFA